MTYNMAEYRDVTSEAGTEALYTLLDYLPVDLRARIAVTIKNHPHANRVVLALLDIITNHAKWDGNMDAYREELDNLWMSGESNETADMFLGKSENHA